MLDKGENMDKIMEPEMRKRLIEVLILLIIVAVYLYYSLSTGLFRTCSGA